MRLISNTEAKKVLYQSPISANSISAGTAKNLRNGSLCLEDIKNYHKKVYKPCHIAILVQGNIDMNFLQQSLHKQLQNKLYMPSPKNHINTNKIEKDALKEMTLPSPTDDLLLICTWEIRVEMMEATKVLLEFFKKNHSVLFR